ncbi:unnamed protein product [Boreogadus saida]
MWKLESTRLILCCAELSVKPTTHALCDALLCFGELKAEEHLFSSESGEFPSEQLPSANPSGRELAHLVGEIVDRATKALNIVLPEKATAAASRFEAEAEEGLRSEIPLLPDFKDLLCRQFTSPSSYHRWSRQTKVFSNMAGQEQVCCGALPAVDQDLVPLFRSPGSLFGGPACLNKDSKAMVSLLCKLHRSTLTLYTHHLSGLMQNQPVDASLAREFQSATLCLASVSKEQAVASGHSLAQLWVVRQHLWLSQSKLQPADSDCLLRMPVEPTAMFGPQASSLLQQARDRRRCADEVSESLGHQGKRARCPGAPAPRVASQSVAQAWGPGDLRHRLQAPRGHGDFQKGGRRGSSASRRGPSRRPHRSWRFAPQIDPFLASTQDILLFLQMQLEAGKSVANLRGMLAAIKAVRIGEFAISEDGCSMISRYLRGARRLTASSRGSQSRELQSLPVSAADQLALSPQQVLPLHVHQILPPECGSGTLLRGAGTWCGSDSEVTLSLQLVSLATCGLTWAAYLHRVPASGLASGRPTGIAFCL